MTVRRTVDVYFRPMRDQGVRFITRLKVHSNPTDLRLHDSELRLKQA